MTTSRQLVMRAISKASQLLVGIVEDDPIMGESLMQRLELEGYATCWWQSGEAALASLPKVECHILICDIRLPDLSGEQLFRRALPALGTTPVIFVTAFGEVEQAVRLMQAGANDYITKPFEIDALLDKIARFAGRRMTASPDTPGGSALAVSPAMCRMHLELRRIADGAGPVLLLGETGVGKEVAARELHATSLRKDQPFIVINCAALSAERAESTIFGHERGGVPGSRSAQIGLIEQAGAGTLFLDEVSVLASPLQAKFLRLVEDGSYMRLGGTADIVSEARIVASSNTDLRKLVQAGQFRADLYYRLNATELQVPPLRGRRDDIIPLAEHFLAQFSRDAGHRIPTMTSFAVTELLEYRWPGNVRELRHRIQRALDSAAAAPQISADLLFPERSLIEEPQERVATLAEAREHAERVHIEEALHQTNREIAKAAALLGISRTTLWEKMRKLGVP